MAGGMVGKRRLWVRVVPLHINGLHCNFTRLRVQSFGKLRQVYWYTARYLVLHDLIFVAHCSLTNYSRATATCYAVLFPAPASSCGWTVSQ